MRESESYKYTDLYSNGKSSPTINHEIGPMPIEKNKVKNKTHVRGIQSREGPKPG